MNSTGKKISQLRKQAGFTQKTLADALCVTDKAVSKWERGLACPDISLLPKLSALLDADIENLLLGVSTITTHLWKGVLLLNGDILSDILIFDKPMVYYLISNFMLMGIKFSIPKKSIEQSIPRNFNRVPAQNRSQNPAATFRLRLHSAKRTISPLILRCKKSSKKT